MAKDLGSLIDAGTISTDAIAKLESDKAELTNKIAELEEKLKEAQVSQVVDSDGQEIHVGDRLMYKNGSSVIEFVAALVGDGKVADENGFVYDLSLDHVTHFSGDTWESILTEAKTAEPLQMFSLVERCKKLAGAIDG